MAIDAADFPLLLREAAARPFAGSLLTLGRQEVTLTARAVRALASRLALAVPKPAALEGWDGDACLDDARLFAALGFSRTDSMDISAYEGASVLHDLNAADLPPDLAGRFDVVFDRGTTEHVFHVPNALSAIARLCRVGGRVMHLSPSTNHMDHGFVMFSPCLLHGFYAANGFEVVRVEMIRQPWLDRHPVIEIRDYAPGCLDNFPAGSFDDAGYQVFVVAEKRPGATHDRAPKFRPTKAEGYGLGAAMRIRLDDSMSGRAG